MACVTFAWFSVNAELSGERRKEVKVSVVIWRDAGVEESFVSLGTEYRSKMAWRSCVLRLDYTIRKLVWV